VLISKDSARTRCVNRTEIIEVSFQTVKEHIPVRAGTLGVGRLRPAMRGRSSARILVSVNLDKGNVEDFAMFALLRIGSKLVTLAGPDMNQLTGRLIKAGVLAFR
jgi:hypothetical protein